MKAWLYPYAEYLVTRYSLGYGKYIHVYYTENGELMEVQVV